MPAESKVNQNPLEINNAPENSFLLTATSLIEEYDGAQVEVEIAQLPTGCTLGTKYILTDTWGTEDDPDLQFAVIAKLQAGDAGWDLADPKVTINNLIINFIPGVSYWNTPLVLMTVDETLLTETQYLDWENSISSPMLNPVRIGVIFPNTDAYLSGSQIVELAEEKINEYSDQQEHGIQFDFVTFNAYGSAALHLEYVQMFDSIGINLIHGGAWSSQAGASLNYINENDMLLLSPSSTSFELAIEGDNLFRLTPTDVEQAKAAAYIHNSREKLAVVFIQTEDFHADLLYDAFVDVFGSLGGVVIDRIIYNLFELDESIVEEILLRADAALAKASVDYEYEEMSIQFMGFNEVTWFLNEAYNEGKYPNIYNVKWFGGEVTGMVQDILDFAPDAADHFKLYSTVPSPDESALLEHQWFYQWYNDTFGTYPIIYSVNDYDIPWIYAQCVWNTSSVDTYSIKSVLPDVAASFPRVSGLCELDEYGDRYPIEYEIFQYGYENGQLSSFPVGRYYRNTTVAWYPP